MRQASNHITIPETFTHSCAIGQTGCGKTTSYIYPNIEARIKSGHGLLVYDYKAKDHAVVKVLAKRHGRLDDVVELGKPWGENINIIKQLSLAEFTTFMRHVYEGHSDAYWSDASVNITTAIMDVQRCLEKLCHDVAPINHHQLLNSVLKLKHHYKPLSTLSHLMSVVQSVKILRNYSTHLKPLLERLLTFIQGMQLTQTELKNILEHYVHLENAIDNAKKVLALFEDTQNTKLLHTHVTAMVTQLSAFASKTMFNHDGFDMVAALNAGKIIVVQTQGLHKSLLSQFTSSLLLTLSRRAHTKSLKPISVFMDEMQRVVDRTTDLPVDLFRESKIELFVAFQNINLAINSMGKTKFFSFYENLGHYFIYKGPIDSHGFNCSDLESFEYFNGLNTSVKSKAKALFIEEKERYRVELEYQKAQDVFNKMGVALQHQAKILVYDEYTLMQGKLLLRDSKGGEDVIKLHDPLVTKRVEALYLKILKTDANDEEICTQKESETAMEFLTRLFSDDDPKRESLPC